MTLSCVRGFSTRRFQLSHFRRRKKIEIDKINEKNKGKTGVLNRLPPLKARVQFKTSKTTDNIDMKISTIISMSPDL